jgi:hypothetical protein
MLSRAQQILVKRAQREVGLSDAEYREALEAVSGCRSSTDARLTDRQCDLVLSYFEAIYWRRADAGELQEACKPNAVFRQRRYWAQKNTRQESSRDRYAATAVAQVIAQLESALGELGFGAAYCASVRATVTEGRTDPRSLHAYKAALQRTLRAKQRQFSEPVSASSQPF